MVMLLLKVVGILLIVSNFFEGVSLRSEHPGLRSLKVCNSSLYRLIFVVFPVNYF